MSAFGRAGGTPEMLCADGLGISVWEEEGDSIWQVACCTCFLWILLISIHETKELYVCFCSLKAASLDVKETKQLTQVLWDWSSYFVFEMSVRGGKHFSLKISFLQTLFWYLHESGHFLSCCLWQPSSSLEIKTIGQICKMQRADLQPRVLWVLLHVSIHAMIPSFGCFFPCFSFTD